MFSNYHTHTVFCDGADTPEELVLEAIRLGCPEIGFSGHSCLAEDCCSMTEEGTLAYCAEIRRLQEAYRGRITIRLGIEQDYFSSIDRAQFDYVIGAVHFLKKDRTRSIDESRGRFLDIVQNAYDGDVYSLAEEYFSLVGDLWQHTHCDVIAHFDLITKFNEGGCLFDTGHPRYRAAADAALDALMESPCLLEVNTGAMARGYRSEPYPEQRILDRWLAAGKEIILSSDCHAKQNLIFAFDSLSRLPYRETLPLRK